MQFLAAIQPADAAKPLYCSGFTQSQGYIGLARRESIRSERMSSPEGRGGRGYTYEDAVAAAYLAGLLGESFPPAPSLERIGVVSAQQLAHGAPMDDVIVDGWTAAGDPARLSLQAKQTLTISAGASNTDWRECLDKAWRTLSAADFRDGRDRIGVATETITDSVRKDFQQICEWAGGSLDTAHFLATVGEAKKKEHLVAQTRALLADVAGRDVTPDELHRFFAHFVLLKLDMLGETATVRASSIAALARAMRPGQSIAPSSVWNELRTIARDASGISGQFDRAKLLTKLAGVARFDVAPSLRGDIDKIAEEARLAAGQIPSDVDGFEIGRGTYVDAVWPDKTPDLLLLTGQPGAGKSVVLKKAVQRALEIGPAIFIKWDRVEAGSFREFTTKLGINADAEALLSEVGATGSPILFIDGLDRIGVKERAVILDLLQTIATLRGRGYTWRVVATLRDYGMEPLRAWLPPSVFAGGGPTKLVVQSFNDDEADALADAKAHLRPLLFGAPAVREIARRPFFASVLGRGLADVTPTPQTEVDLIRHWWRLGGFNADQKEALVRQRAIIELGRAGLSDIGGAIQVSRFSLPSIGVLAELREDSVIRDEAVGKTVRFGHDIFFEWALFNVLEEAGASWIDELRNAGEPPFLGRVVELLAQASYPDAGWEETIPKLRVGRRPQWLRAWLLGPLGASGFKASEGVFTRVALADDCALARKALVWFQAEKTTPNATVIAAEQPQLQRFDARRRLALADALSVPSDVRLWSRFIAWIARHRTEISLRLAPDITAVFGVWQNMFCDYKNDVSNVIIVQSLAWLQDLEERFEFGGYSADAGPWEAVDRDERDALTKALRRLVLRAAHTYPEELRLYLARFAQKGRLKEDLFEQIMAFSWVLARAHAAELAGIVRAHLFEELPEEEIERERSEMIAHREAVARIEAQPEEERTKAERRVLEHPALFHHIGSHRDWEHLCIGEGYGVYQPASPLREPFHSLFKFAPDDALQLVRDICNHAAEAWRQLQRVGDRSKGTPESIVVSLPWGDQTFWGDNEHYLWARGGRGPPAVASALMALDAWALRQLKDGADPDDVMRVVVNGHESFAVLGVAMAVALQAQLVSDVSIALVITPHIWQVDMHRVSEDRRGPPNEFAINISNDVRSEHAEAIKAGNNEPGRFLEVRDLVTLIALRGTPEQKARLRSAIAAFPENLPFFFKEERDDPGCVAYLRKRAEVWAPLGRAEIYNLRPTEDGKAIQIEANNPAVDPAELARVQQQLVRTNSETGLYLWANKTFENGALADGLTLDAALGLAQAFDRSDLFAPVQDFRGVSFLPGSVAGVAAAVLRYGAPDSPAWAWSVGLLKRVLAAELSGQRIDDNKHHPLVFAVHALKALIERDIDREWASETLLGLMISPLREVVLTAYAALCALRPVAPSLADAAACLGVELSMSDNRGLRDYIERDKRWRKRAGEALNRALSNWRKGAGWGAAPKIPPPYIHAAPLPTGDEFYDKRRSLQPMWRAPDLAFDLIRAKDFAPRLPVKSIMTSDQAEPFFSYCDDLVAWTIEYCSPSWRDPKERARRDRDVELKNWLRILGSLFARVSICCPKDDSLQRLVSPLAALDDECAQPFLYSYSSSLICRAVLDGDGDVAVALNILSVCLKRILQHHAFERGRYREGRIYDSDVQRSLRAFMFVEVGPIAGARRFLNGNWSDLDLVRPIIEEVVTKAGWTPDGALAFTTLCERAGEAYRLEWFATDVLSILDPDGFPTPEWRQTGLPLGIANLIQEQAQHVQPLPGAQARQLLTALDILIDYGDRRSASLQSSELFRHVQN